MREHKILVVDDEEPVRYALERILTHHGYTSLLAPTGAEAIALAQTTRVDLALLDLVMPEMDGMETLSQLKRIDPELPIVMITGRGDIASAVRATKLGAYDFITKPPDPPRLIQTIQRAIDLSETQRSTRQLESTLEWVFGKSAATKPVIRRIPQSAWTDSPVTIQGEGGTGRSVAARIIHNLSKRANLPFLFRKTGAIPESLFEEELFGAGRASGRKGKGILGGAKGGTVFIDGLSRIPLSVQARLARSIEEGRTHPSHGAEPTPRFIMGTVVDLAVLARENDLDEHLRRCLSEPPIVLPPLRERPEDVGFLANKFLWKASMEFGIEVDELGEDALNVLAGHSWPGNIRELESVVRGSLLLSEGRVLKPELVKSVIESTTKDKGLVLLRLREASALAGEKTENQRSKRNPVVDSLREAEERFRSAIRQFPVGIFAHVEGRIAFANPAFARIVGAAKPEELRGRMISDFVAADPLSQREESGAGVAAKWGEAPFREQRLLRLDGNIIVIEAATLPFSYQGGDGMTVVVHDITERKRLEEAGRIRQNELNEKSIRLQEENSSLKLALSHRDRDKEELENSILANVKKQVFPYIDRVKAGRLTESQMAYMEMIESSLNLIISPFAQRLSALYSGFTPTEIQIAALIKDGKTTKEIAELLGVGTGTVHTHRNGIRNKLKISNKDINLRSFLLSLQE